MSVDFDEELFGKPNKPGQLHRFNRLLFQQPIPVNETLIIMRIDSEVPNHERRNVLKEM